MGNSYQELSVKSLFCLFPIGIDIVCMLRYRQRT